MNSFEAQFEKILGFVLMAFFGLMQVVMAGILIYYALPASTGVWRFLTINGILFFGAGALMFGAYLLPARPLRRYRRPDGAYRFNSSFTLRAVGVVVGFYSIFLLPLAFLYMAVIVPYFLVTNPQSAILSFQNTDWNLWEIFQAGDALLGLPVLIGLLIYFPWLFPKFVRAWWRVTSSLFKPSGMALDQSGIRFFGAHAITVPWSLIRRADVVVQSYTEIVVLHGDARLNEFRMKLDPRLPKSVRKDFGEDLVGLPLNLQGLRVRPRELAHEINRCVGAA